MKYIKFETIDVRDSKEKLHTKQLIEAALRFADKERGVVLEEMMKRMRIWKALDSNTDPLGLTLEDGDFELLEGCLKRFPFGAASREMCELASGIVASKAPPGVMLNGKGKHKEQPSAQA
jgi:hypothetical protein